MKILLILPAKNSTLGHDFLTLKQLANLTGKTTGGMNLSLATLAALTPVDVEVSLVDENVEGIDFRTKADLVGVSFLTSLAPRAYEISRKFRARGVPVVLGGIHVSSNPEEAQKFADSIVIGEAEEIWSTLIKDFKNKSLGKVYRAERFPDLEQLVIPRWDLMKVDRYSSFSIQTGRGCPYGCDFCSVRMFNGDKYRHKPIENVIKELEFAKGLDSRKPVFFADDNLLAIPGYAKDLLVSIQPLGLKNWWCQTSIDRLKDKELVKLLNDAGCNVVFVGLESVSQPSLKSMGKTKVNRVAEYEEIISYVHSQGIAVFGSFMLGGDGDFGDIFEVTADFINKNNLPYAMVNYLTPIPGSKLFDRFEDENRLITKDWRHYNGEFVSFKPKNMTVRELQFGRAWLLSEIYSYKAMYRRLKSLWRKGSLVRKKESKRFFSKGRILFTLKAFISKDLKRFLFVFKSLWNSKVTSIGPISLALSFHDYAVEYSHQINRFIENTEKEYLRNNSQSISEKASALK